MSERCLQGWYSAPGCAEQSGRATCSPGSLLGQAKVSISCRGRITPLQMHLPHCAVEKALCASVREGGTAWLTLSLGIPGSQCHGKVYFHAKWSGLLFQLLLRPRCDWRLKRGERTVMCFTQRIYRWGWVDHLIHSENQIRRSKGKTVDQAAQQSPWK